MSRPYNKEIAKSYLFDAYSDAEHAGTLAEIARYDLNENDSRSRALESLKRSLESSERATSRIRSAIEYLELEA